MDERNRSDGVLDQAGSCSDEPFSFDGYQVTRREFFAYTQEPAISFNRFQIYVNSVCLKKCPEVDYVQILVNPEAKKLVIRPCGEDERDSFSWRSNCKIGRKPKQITCRIFYTKIMDLMGWDPQMRYKLLGKLVHANDEDLFLFDLNAPQMFTRKPNEQAVRRPSRVPILPAEWKDQFGSSVEEHRRSLRIDLFDGYTVFGIRLPEPKPLPVSGTYSTESGRTALEG